MANTTKKVVRMASALGVACSLGALTAQAATFEADFHGQYRASAFGVQNKDAQTQTDKETGLSHLMRIGVDFTHEETGVQLFTSVDIAGERWQGDRYNYPNRQHYNNTVRS